MNIDALDSKLVRAVQQFRARFSEITADALHGLYISDSEVDGLLARTPMRSGLDSIVCSRLQELARIFALDDFDQEVLLICVAPELDLRYERLYGYLQDDMTRRRATIDLVSRLLSRDLSEVWPALRSSGALTRHGLLSMVNDDGPESASLVSTALKVERRVTQFLLGEDGLDRKLENCARVVEPAPGNFSEGSLYAEQLDSLVEQFSVPGDWTCPGPIIYVHGSDSSARLHLAREWGSAVGARLLVVDFGLWHAALSGSPSGEDFVGLTREALLQNASLVIRAFDPSLDGSFEGRLQLRLLRHALENHPKLTFLIGNTRWESATWCATRFSLSIELEGPTTAERTRQWARHLDARFPAEAASELGARYRLVEEDDMHAVMQGAIGRASLRRSRQVSMCEVLDAARAISSPPLVSLAQRVTPHHRWDDIVLPADALQRLRELCARFRHRATVYETWDGDSSQNSRRGLAALFVGQPGTGKSMAAEIVAADLGYDLYRIDLSAVVSKYIGETEKNLEAIFRAAEQGEVVLVFDEADALFGKRSEVRDAHDRYANVEVAYLLQRLESFAGVAILTSNLSGNLDDAFTRRLDFLVEFPLPDENQRREIWRRSLPVGAPRAVDLDIDELARAFRLSGGHIHNSALAAAFLAADDGGSIARRHALHAIRREYEKLGKLVTELDALGAD